MVLYCRGSVMIHVACASDEGYAPHAAVMIRSLLAANNPRDVTVHYLHAPGFDASVRETLRTWVESLGGAIRFHAVADSDVSSLPTPDGIPPAIWYRAFLPNLLPELDRVLYLDCDLVVLAPLGTIWDLPLTDSYVAAVSNVFVGETAGHARSLGLAPWQEYFNTGVLVLNLDRMRADGCTAKIMDYGRMLDYSEGQTHPWPEQDTLNVVLGERRVQLHPQWNCMNSMFLFSEAKGLFGQEKLSAAIRDPKILHFEGPSLAKPWHYLNKHPSRRLYAQYRTETPWPSFKVEGRTWWNMFLRPLPTSAQIALLVRWASARAAVDRHLTTLGHIGRPRA